MRINILVVNKSVMVANILESRQRQGRMAEFVEWIEGISVNELGKLVTALEDRLGVGTLPEWIGSSGELHYDSRRAARVLSQGSWYPDDYGRLLMMKKHGSKKNYRNHAGNYNGHAKVNNVYRHPIGHS